MSMAAEAEAIFSPSYEQKQPPPVIIVPEMPEDQMVRQRAERFIRGAGAAALHQHVELEYQKRESLPDDQISSLMDAIQRAAWGDAEAIQFITNNVRTDMFERTVKAGLIMKAKLSIDQNGAITQHGQAMETTHENALRFASATPEIRERSKPETRNGFRIGSLYREGMLEDYYFVVKSRCADNIPFEQLDDNGFFSETLSASIQATTAMGDGLITESAFVAGVKKPGMQPHDVEAIIAMGAVFGVDYSNKSAAEIIDTPLLIHKSLMPNGVIDLVRLYDICAGGTFFGEDKPQQDYLNFVEFCQAREQELGPLVEKIVQQLISEAHKIHTPVAAVKRLHALSQKYMLERSIEDRSINPRVFGPAAPLIEQARLHHDLGNTELAQAATDKAQRVAKSYSCPGMLLEENSAENEASETSENSSEEVDSKTGTIRCIKCRKYVSKEKVVKKDHWECPKCNHKVEICSGEVVREGVISQPKEQKMATVSLMFKKMAEKRREKINIMAVEQAA